MADELNPDHFPQNQGDIGARIRLLQEVIHSLADLSSSDARVSRDIVTKLQYVLAWMLDLPMAASVDTNEIDMEVDARYTHFFVSHMRARLHALRYVRERLMELPDSYREALEQKNVFDRLQFVEQWVEDDRRSPSEKAAATPVGSMGESYWRPGVVLRTHAVIQGRTEGSLAMIDIPENRVLWVVTVEPLSGRVLVEAILNELRIWRGWVQQNEVGKYRHQSGDEVPLLYDMAVVDIDTRKTSLLHEGDMVRIIFDHWTVEHVVVEAIAIDYEGPPLNETFVTFKTDAYDPGLGMIEYRPNVRPHAPYVERWG